GSYNTRLTLVGAILLPALPLCLAAEMLGIPYRTRRQPGDAAAGRPANHWRWMVILGMVAIAVAAGAFLLGYQKSQEPIVTETVALALAKPPQSGHVRMTAIARTDMIMRFEERGRLRFYVPLTAPNWKRSDPLVYFLQTNITAYVGPD